MILKIKEGARWVYIDKIRRVSVEKRCMSEIKNYKLDKNFLFLSGVEATEKGSEKILIFEILVIFNDDTRRTLISSQEESLFLLNDAGKTIERL